MLDPHFVFLGACISLVGSLRYAWDTVQGRTQPNRVTWGLWAAAPAIACAAAVAEGAGLVAFATLSFGIGPFIIFCASFVNPEAVWKTTRFDWVCGGCSALALAAWAITRDGNLAIGLSLLADALALLPTLRKSLRRPQSESWLVYLLASCNAGIALLTISDWSFAKAAFPVYVIAHCLLLFFLVRFRLGPRLVPSWREDKRVVSSDRSLNEQETATSL
jgi:hypothetical protein